MRIINTVRKTFEGEEDENKDIVEIVDYNYEDGCPVLNNFVKELTEWRVMAITRSRHSADDVDDTLKRVNRVYFSVINQVIRAKADIKRPAPAPKNIG